MGSAKSPHKEVTRTRADRICDAISRFGGLDARQVANLLGISQGCAYDHMRKLIKAKRLRKSPDGFGQADVYYLVKN